MLDTDRYCVKIFNILNFRLEDGVSSTVVGNENLEALSKKSSGDGWFLMGSRASMQVLC